MGRLFWKFFFAFWLTLLFAAGGVGTGVWLHRQATDDDEVPLAAAGGRSQFWLESASAVLRRGGPQALREAMLELPQRPGGMTLFAIGPDGRDLLARPLPPAEARRAPSVEVQASDGTRYTLFIAGERLRPEHLRYRHEPPPSPWLPIGAALLASLGFSVLLAWYVAKPIRLLRRGFSDAAAGRLEARVAPSMGGRRDELADLGRDFDTMAERLQMQISAQRRLMHDVSHELRSPLARLQAAIGLARQDPARLEATLERIEREAVRLDELVGELLTLSRLEAGGRGEHRERLDLFELVAGIADDAAFEARAAGRDLALAGEGSAQVDVQPELIYRAFENVIRNAVKYTAEASTVDVRLALRDGQFVATVADRGQGVPEGELESIFEPFYRASGAAPASGFGLGLAIARRAVEFHGGRIRAENREGGGLTVELSLPLVGS